METAELNIQGEDAATEREMQLMMQELASVEQSLSTLQKKNQLLKQTYEQKQKVVLDQKRMVDQRNTQIETVSQKVS